MHQATLTECKKVLPPEQIEEPRSDVSHTPWWSGRFYTGAHRPAVHIDRIRRVYAANVDSSRKKS